MTRHAEMTRTRPPALVLVLVLVLGLAASAAALDHLPRGDARGAAVAFNRGRSAADIAAALDNRAEEEAGGLPAPPPMDVALRHAADDGIGKLPVKGGDSSAANVAAALDKRAEKESGGLPAPPPMDLTLRQAAKDGLGALPVKDGGEGRDDSDGGGGVDGGDRAAVEGAVEPEHVLRGHPHAHADVAQPGHVAASRGHLPAAQQHRVPAVQSFHREEDARLHMLRPDEMRVQVGQHHQHPDDRQIHEGDVDEFAPGRPPEGDVEADFPEIHPRTKFDPPETMLSLYRQSALREMGDGGDPAVVRTALEHHVSRLEAYVLKHGALRPEQMAPEERKKAQSLCADVEFDLREQRRAFVQLVHEKKHVDRMLKDEQAALDQLQEKVRNPDLTQWIKQRTARVREYFDTPETDAVAYYARRYVEPQMFKARERIAAFEGRLEKTVDAVLPAKYGSLVAALLAIIVVGAPIVVTVAAMLSIHKAISMRQHVLLCNVFITTFVIVLSLCGLVLRADPLKTLYTASESGFVFLQFALCLLFFGSLAMLSRALYHSRDERDLMVFGSQVVFYVLVGYNYHRRVIAPALLGYRIDTNFIMYVVYVVDFVAMSALTVSSAIPDPSDTLPLSRHAAVARHAGSGTDSAVHAHLSKVGRRTAASATPAVGGGIVPGSQSLSRIANGISASLDSKIA